jgi:hypothetical protein
LRRNSSTSGTTARAATVTVSETAFHECSSASQANSGRKESCPAAPPAVRTPVTRPRRRTNHRLVTVATKASAIDPAPRPTSTPQHRTSCHWAVMNSVSPLPSAISDRALATTTRIPKRSIRAAANGEVRP